MLSKSDTIQKKKKIILKKETKNGKEELYAILPLKDIIIFPKMVVPLFIEQEQAINIIEATLEGKYKLIVTGQKKDSIDSPKKEDLHTVGTLLEIMQAIRFPNNTIKLLAEGIQRVNIRRILKETPFFTAYISLIEEKYTLTEEIKVLIKFITSQFESYLQLAGKGVQDYIGPLPEINEPGKLADMIAAYLPLSLKDKQNILEEFDPVKRLENIGKLLSKEMEFLTIERQVNERMRFHVEKHQKEYFLREKMKSIREELGEENEWDIDIAEYRKKITSADLPKEAKEKAQKELQRLEKMPLISAEGSVVRNYLDLILELPWHKVSDEKINLKKAKEILDHDHYGLEKVKDRILEFLAVKHLEPKDTKGTSILCLVGPPGVGKTSLAQSVARSLNRKFERISLGGVGDDSEIRGHRRTYIGAMPGRIIDALRKAEAQNPVILLDEIDKLTKHYHGDPASALLEVLDPEQNSTFKDHFLDIPFNLSKIFFICAANITQTIPKPLFDRMDALHLPGYTEQEKIVIARNYLIPRQIDRNGLKPGQLKITIKTIKEIIRYYTREAGVRELERSIGKICRKTARLIVEKNIKYQKVDSNATIVELLGPPVYTSDIVDEQDEIGVVYGLAWTETGGSILPIEVSLSNGKGKLNLTGSLGDVMKESAQIALAYLKTNAENYKIDKKIFTQKDIFLHVPEGAIPKDGPSAGIALTMAILSAFTKRPASCKHSMTGEISLKGKILKIGGLKEKCLAAHRHGVHNIIIPQDNLADIEDFPNELKTDLKFIPVKNIRNVVDFIFK